MNCNKLYKWTKHLFIVNAFDLVEDTGNKAIFVPVNGDIKFVYDTVYLLT